MWARMSALLFQNRCVFCQEASLGQNDICPYCVEDLPTISSACTRCALPMPASSGSLPLICGACLRSSPPLRNTTACCHYAFPADFLVQQLKFSGQFKYARVMGGLLAESLVPARHSDINLILPVPLSARRYRQRGFNQAAEIAHFTAQALDRKIRRQALQRCLDQPPQAGLGRDLRKRNIRGAFVCDDSVSGLRCVLVDDVMTTGSTLFEAAATLLKAGAVSVDAWVFARTPPD